MTTPVATLDPGMTLREAAVVFADRRVSGAAVVIHGRVLGVLSASDIVEAESATRKGAGDSAIRTLGSSPETRGSVPAFFGRSWPDAAIDVNERFGPDRRQPVTPGNPLDTSLVADVMSRHVLEIRPEAPLTDAAERMAAAGVHRLLVVDDSGLVGIITTSDIARWLARHRRRV